MTLHVHNMTFDCGDARALATFWSKLTGWNLYYDDDPEVVVALGRFALEFFLPGERISRVHGRPRRLGARTFLPMLHPAAALHQTSWRPQLQADFATLGEILAAPEPQSVSQSEPADESDAQLTLF